MLDATLRPPSEPRSGILPVDPRTVIDIASSMVRNSFADAGGRLIQFTSEISTEPMREIRIDGSMVWIIFSAVSSYRLPEGMGGATVTLEDGTQKIMIGFVPDQSVRVVDALLHAVEVMSHEMAHAIDPLPITKGSADEIAMSLSDLIHSHARAMLGHDLPLTITVPRYTKNGEIDALIHVKRETHAQEVLGHRGQLLKEIMLRTRAELEREMSMPVKLKLEVTTKPDKTAEEYYNHPNEVNAYLTQEIVKLYLLPEGYIVPLIAAPFDLTEVYRHTNYPTYKKYLTPRNRRRFALAAFWWYESTRESVANKLEALKAGGEFPPWFTLQDFANYLEEQMRKDRRTYRKAVTLETLQLRREMYAR
jgi:hypothetical protein